MTPSRNLLVLLVTTAATSTAFVPTHPISHRHSITLYKKRKEPPNQPDEIQSLVDQAVSEAIQVEEKSTPAVPETPVNGNDSEEHEAEDAPSEQQLRDESNMRKAIDIAWNK